MEASSMLNPVKRCTAKQCGILQIVSRITEKQLGHWESQTRLFMGLDVSSQFAGIACCKVVGSTILVVGSNVVNLRRKTTDTKDGLLERRFDLLRAHLAKFRALHGPDNEWTITVEDKLMRAGQAKGIIGSHTLAEIGVAARLAAYLEYPGSHIATVNPRSARSGLQINVTSESSREETKRRVITTVKSLFPEISWQGDATDEDRADACLIALSGLRSLMNKIVVSDPEIRRHYRACHLKDGYIPPMGRVQQRRDEDDITAELEERVQTWVDAVWFRPYCEEVLGLK